jgi:hypothetical protein
MTLASTTNLVLTPVQVPQHQSHSPCFRDSLQLMMMPWFMGMGARLFSWEVEGIVVSFLEVVQDT